MATQTELEARGSVATPDGVLRNEEVDPELLASSGPWDGTRYSYIPPRNLGMHESVRLHDSFDSETDPVTFQVVRWGFWNLNLEHMTTVQRMSGSPMVTYMEDLNTSILTETGDIVMGGPTIQYFTGMADLSVKWTLEKRSANPGIRPGDIFLHNDPYIGAFHQMEVALLAPIFIDGRIFAWVFSAAHQRDIGGLNPSSFVPQAEDIYAEPTPWPSTKLVDRGELREDVTQLFMRQCRTPELTLLQLRGQIAGIKNAQNRILHLVRRFGADTVKGVMRGIIRDCSAAVSRRLLSLPDGRWDEAYYVSPDDHAHLVRTSITKVGDQLTFSNVGTSKQFGSGNGTFSTFRAGAICAMSAFLAWDQLYCPAGVVNHLRLRPEAGTLTVATYPAATTCLNAPIVGLCQSGLVVGRMLLTGSPELRRRVNASGGLASVGYSHLYGTDLNDQLAIASTPDPPAGAIGAFPEEDGINTGGSWWWPRTNAGNVEEFEHVGPLFYLYRREQQDSAGAGRFRGGNGLETAIMGHKVKTWSAVVMSNDPAINCSPGLGGGMPGHSGNWLARSGTRIRTAFAEGCLPSTKTELETELRGAIPRIPVNGTFDLGPDGVMVVEYCSGGGFGDPLTRDPALVLQDVVFGDVSVEGARRDYGVIFNGGEIDAPATEELRSERRSSRMEGALEPVAPPEVESVQIGPDPLSVAPGVVIGHADGVAHLACRECGRVLSGVHDNFKGGCARRDVSPTEIDPNKYPNPSDFCQDDIVFRTWFCPGCRTQLGIDIQRPEDEVLWDVQLIGEIGAGDE